MKVIFENECLDINTMEAAKEFAEKEGLDLFEIAKDTYIIGDYGKWQYQRKKNLKNVQSQQTKVLQVGPFINEHDLERKIKDACTWLEKGDNVQVKMRIFGRLNHKDELITNLFTRISDIVTKKNLVSERPIIRRTELAEGKRDFFMMMKAKGKKERIKH